jgi:tetratricopeptide (TPR) repeat protein
MALVNASMAYARMGEPNKAQDFLLKAIKVAPDNAPAHFNLGLLKAEQQQPREAERELKEAFRLDPQMAPAAYNLCVLMAKDRPAEALSWCRKAVELNPGEPKYALTLAFYQKGQGDLKAAATTLQDLLRQRPAFTDAYLMLAEIYGQQGNRSEAEAVLRKAQQVESLSPQDRARIAAMLRKWGTPEPQKDHKTDNR